MERLHTLAIWRVWGPRCSLRRVEPFEVIAVDLIVRLMVRVPGGIPCLIPKDSHAVKLSMAIRGGQASRGERQNWGQCGSKRLHGGKLLTVYFKVYSGFRASIFIARSSGPPI